MYKLAPSLLAADFSRLGDELGVVSRAGAHYIHIDVMDGHFVPNISLGLPVIEALRKTSALVFDVHLMISQPERYFADFARAGADIINFHAEAVEDIGLCAREIRDLGKRPAVTVKPLTPIEAVYDYLELVDMVLIMSVEPGRGGQRLIPQTLKKAEKLAGFMARNGISADIEMDGGICLENLEDVLKAGVNVVVAGSAVFGAAEPAEAIREFYKAFANRRI